MEIVTERDLMQPLFGDSQPTDPTQDEGRSRSESSLRGDGT